MTTESSERLIQCFLAVFPALEISEVRSASLLTTDSWDSLATVTLISVIEEEFGIEISDDDLQNFSSFARIDSIIRSTLLGSAGAGSD